ncbi:CHAT domain-containing protein [Altericista sp. CCNU0014]|uniref:CHAT domain-containing protein n=1 Tax=Altericista sp. CCNU0014 TaxID=3082949 RepID=UPI00384B8F60
MRVRIFNLLCCAGLVALVWPMPATDAQFNFGSGSNNPSGGRQTPDRGDSSDYPRRRQGPSLLDLDFFSRPSPRAPKPLSKREAFEKRFQEATPAEAVREFESLQLTEFSEYLEMPVGNQAPTAEQISQRLGQIARETGKKPAVLYAVALKKQTHLLLVLPSSATLGQARPMAIASLHLSPAMMAQAASTPPVIREVLPEVSRDDVLDAAKDFRKAVSDPTKLDNPKYRETSEELYRWIVAPLEPQLKAQGIDTLLFSMDDGLRTIPIAALHDGTQFLVEKYSSALIPSFGLTNTNRSLALKQQPMLAMGIAKSTEGLAALPAVSVEIAAITGQFWSGPSRNTLDEDSTLSNLKAMYLQQRFGVLHLATHAVFNAGQADNSYIQFWNARLPLSQIRKVADDLQWKSALPPLQLLVLSACQTALGNKEAELGFAGTAINAGVPSAIASLWAVDDEGTVGLMTGFYGALQSSPTKADALRQAQLRMLRGEVSVRNGQISAPNQPPIALPALGRTGQDASLIHPYFWSGYTVVGNWD